MSSNFFNLISRTRIPGVSLSHILAPSPVFLYQIEKEVKELQPEEIIIQRQEKSKPILKEFEEWLKDNARKSPPKSLLGKAFTYTLSQWPRLLRYLEDGRLRMDNNLAENVIRPFVVGRKNWLFSGTPDGARASAFFFSIIETAKANNLEPYRYLCHLYDHLPMAKTKHDLKTLLPHGLQPGKLISSNSS
jgi:transposase